MGYDTARKSATPGLSHLAVHPNQGDVLINRTAILWRSETGGRSHCKHFSRSGFLNLSKNDQSPSFVARVARDSVK